MKQLSYILYLVFSVVFLGEILFLAFPSLSLKKPPYNTAILDEKLGWKAKGNYLFEGEMLSLDKGTYPISVSTDKYGFRTVRNKQDRDKSILLIGDSFTQSIEVSDDKTYYSIIQDSLNANVSAYGMAGYGTLQELMILESNIDRINPDIVFLQFCSNDFIDNEIELEKKANYYVGMKRPYLDNDNRITYSNPLNSIERLVVKTNFIKFCWEKSGRIRTKLGWKKRNSSEKKIAENANFMFYSNSLEKTDHLIDRIQKSIGDRDLVIFCADHYEPQSSDIERICLDKNILFIPFPKEEMRLEQKKVEVYSIDGYHWNENGHELVAKSIVKAMFSFQNIVDRKDY